MTEDRPEHPRLGRFRFTLRPAVAQNARLWVFVTLGVPAFIPFMHLMEGLHEWRLALKLAGIVFLLLGVPLWVIFFTYVRYRLDVYERGLRLRQIRARELRWDDVVALEEQVAELAILSAGRLKCTLTTRDGQRFIFDVDLIGFDGFCVLVERELALRGVSPTTHVVRPRSLRE